MSRAANDWAWSLNIKPASLKLLLLSMADRADEYHCCYPSIERLVKDTGLNRKTIMSGIDKLINAGLLRDTGERKGATQRVKVYQLNLIEIDEQISLRSNSPKNGIIPKTEPSQKRTLNSPENGTLNSPKNGTQNQSVEPVIETIKKNNTKKTKLDFSLWPEQPAPEILKDWKTVRDRKKSPLTQTAVNRFAKKLKLAREKLGMSVDDVLSLCVERGWCGFEVYWLERDRQQFGKPDINSISSENDFSAPPGWRTSL
ncbi:helix-turn-helix domain-containing protein [Vibrio salinus]|uniref:helix-turn-helix domain-containing protein n=1 Tax=Vibrio salinus TaxID=2899784 RepID=UPI001E2D140A|nr:helix-turn-helix domain-containing protein [Vibrio salinus]MCE0495750.1 helix-turn-helix domain-containing protein [Vibrio salinus]